MRHYRNAFPNKTNPKHHILEKHCVSWIRAHRFVMGFNGEHGGKNVTFYDSEIEYRARGMRRERTKTAFIMETSILQTTQSPLRITL